MTNTHLSCCLLVLALAGCNAAAGAAPPGSDAGSPPPFASDGGPPALAGPEACDDGLDGDADGLVDEGCPCTAGATQACYPGAASTRDLGECASGVQQCEGTSEFGSWGPCTDATLPAAEVCDSGFDEDCDGVDLPCAMDAGTPAPAPDAGPTTPDAGAPPPGDAGPGPGLDAGAPPPPIEVPITFFGDCVTASCPAEAPYPVGCAVTFSPGDDRGCVASRPDSSQVYFQAGDECNAGFVTGHLLCSTVPGAPLDSTNCPISKPVQIHVSDRSMCPETH